MSLTSDSINKHRSTIIPLWKIYKLCLKIQVVNFTIDFYIKKNTTKQYIKCLCLFIFISSPYIPVYDGDSRTCYLGHKTSSFVLIGFKWNFNLLVVYKILYSSWPGLTWTLW